jgi:transcriptional regulator with XRE-family HTH domain
VEGKNKSEVARQAGLSATAVTDYLQKGYIPRADNALALARALNIPVDWLIDDSQDFPPPDSAEKPAATLLSEGQLIVELARRSRQKRAEIIDKLEQFERFDWADAEREFTAFPPHQDIRHSSGCNMLTGIDSLGVVLLYWVKTFDSDFLDHWTDWPPYALGRDKEELRPGKIYERFQRLLHRADIRSLVNRVADRLNKMTEQERAKLPAMLGIISRLQRAPVDGYFGLPLPPMPAAGDSLNATAESRLAGINATYSDHSDGRAVHKAEFIDKAKSKKPAAPRRRKTAR